MTRIRFLVTLFWLLSPVVHATPCPGFYVEPKDVWKNADWIIEGVVTEIRKTGTFRDCERVPSQNPGGDLYCADIDKPEIVVLEDVTVVQDNNKLFSSVSRAEISRMAHCFSSPLSKVMNAKPELNALGKRVRFYGRTHISPPFFQPQLKPGYYWLEMLD